MKCCGAFQIYTTHNTTVCVNCGLETACGYGFFPLTRAQSTYNNHAPLVNVYSRKKRFDKLLLCVLKPCPQSGDNLMLEYLFKRQPIHNIPDLLQWMKTSPLKDKRYCSLHLFCKLLVKKYTPPQMIENMDYKRVQILRAFEDIEFAHARKQRQGPFFNYCWLLSFFLKEFNLREYNQFVKPLKCKHRRKAYADLYGELTNSSTKLRV